ncbi:cytospin-A-like isoform X4 [Macrobrachium nipponense]|uniref:cytospin-A-like isoform X4 n=1 Tax=Macrobrachium nipponense TaxID=159736 RepID=UPI0030C8C42D
MVRSRAPRRDLDCLRALSPLSQRCRRPSNMNPRTPLLLTSRAGGNSSANGGISSSVGRAPGTVPQSQRETTTKCVKAPGTPVTSTKQTRSVRTGPIRPTRVNTAVNATARKASAPGKLINVLGRSLDSLPETVSVRRKTSAPVKSVGGNSSTSNNNIVAKKNSGSLPVKVKKFSSASAPGGTVSSRMSKDHGGSGQQGHKSSGGGAITTSTKEQNQKGTSKKISTSSAGGGPDVQSLPTLKEEKKPPTNKSSGSQKMEAGKDKENQPLSNAKTQVMPPQPTQPPDTTTTTTLSTTPQIPDAALGPNLDATSSCSCSDKPQLEKTVSDLVKNCESKKQEIAALKMEINRLKEALRERGHYSDDENTTKPSSCGAKSGGSSSTTQSGNTASSLSNATTQVSQSESVSSTVLDNSCHLTSTVQKLSAENKHLKDRLLMLGVNLDSSPLSDQEKELLQSIVSTVSQNGGDGPSSCGDRAEWDNKSTSSYSESVACLQDRIQQMEETHYCTNEELQATLQELDDLREQLSEFQLEVQTLQEEKQVILESLTQQTEKLNEARSHNDTLKQMLIQQSENSQDLSQCEKTQRLMDLLKSAQEDREILQLKQEELEQQVATTKDAEERFHHDSQLIRDRMKMLESMVEAANNEKKAAENQLAEALESNKATEIEIARLQTALDSAKEKITELEAAVISGEKSELADVLERVKQEKDTLEKENSVLQQKITTVACENERLKDQISSLQDELMVSRNNAKSQREDADWKTSQLEKERHHLEEEMDMLRNTVEDLKLACQHHLEDKRDLKANLSEAQKKLNETLDKLGEKDRAFSEERSQFNKQVEEWEQFQSDLLMTVRVANDFKTEAQHDLERLTQENTMLRERLKQLGQDLEKAKAVKVCSPVTNSSNSSLSNGSSSSERRTLRSVPTSLPNGEPSILADRRNPRPVTRGDSRVKSLIESIECVTRQTRANSRSSSASSLCSTSSESNTSNSKSAPLLKRADTESVIRGNSSSPLKDAGNTLGSSTASSPLRALQRNSFTEGLTQTSFPQSAFSKTSGNSNLSENLKMSQLSDKISGKITGLGTVENSVSKPPLSILSNKLDHSVRRNSYGQISAVVDKKDPLASLAQGGGSKRNALLKWCQNKTIGYTNVDITNFSSSWNDGLALCAILDTYLPEKIGYKALSPINKRENFEVAISAAESVGIHNSLDVSDMITSERPNWQTVYNYVTSIYCHFET